METNCVTTVHEAPVFLEKQPVIRCASCAGFTGSKCRWGITVLKDGSTAACDGLYVLRGA